MTTKRLYRSCRDKMLGGVAGGLGEYFDIDPILVRLIFVILIISGGIGIVLYLVAWVIIPEDPSCGQVKSGADEIREKAESFANEINDRVNEKKTNKKIVRKNDRGAITIGLIILAVGIIFLLQNILGVNFWNILWPIIIIAIGIGILIDTAKE